MNTFGDFFHHKKIIRWVIDDQNWVEIIIFFALMQFLYFIRRRNGGRNNVWISIDWNHISLIDDRIELDAFRLIFFI